MTTSSFPAWLEDIRATLAVHSQFIVWGNIRDRYLIADGDSRRMRPLLQALWSGLSDRGYECLLVYDKVDGLIVVPDSAGNDLPYLPAPDSAGRRELSLAALQDVMAAAVRDAPSGRHVAIVIDYASRLTIDAQRPEPGERDFFLFSEKLSQTARPVLLASGHPPLYNPIIWIANREGDLPSWLIAGNDTIRSVAIPMPGMAQRLDAARNLLPMLQTGETANGDLDADATSLAELSDGMTLASMSAVVRLAGDRGFGPGRIAEAVRSFKVGVLENPWDDEVLRTRLAEGEVRLSRRVFGQPQAVTKAMDMLKRSALGLSGSLGSRASTKPRGVMFFAGPTGVGKTELAKALTELVFGDETAYIRFDMSEFSSEHADARLIGSPPGFVGHEDGGELTNAIRRRPFSLVLFDEIEKAHPRILDKFLQVLEDGRLTDGRGNTVYFSECIIVFTSNLGTISVDASGAQTRNVTPDMEYAEVERRIRSAVQEHFTYSINRPELLNRLGDNIIVFDYISTDIAGDILDAMLANITRRMADEHSIGLTLSAEVRTSLRESATRDLAMGGRGIGSIVESQLVNPLARAMFGQGASGAEAITVERIVGTATGVELVLA